MREIQRRMTKKKSLCLNPKHKTMNQNTNIKIKIKNKKCARPKYKHNFYHDKYENNKTRLWNKIIFLTCVKHTQGNEGSYLYLYAFGDLIQRSFHGSFHVPTNHESI
jgi:hypothetical protein